MFLFPVDLNISKLSFTEGITLLVAIISTSTEDVWVSSLPKGREEKITWVIITAITFWNSRLAANFWQLVSLTQVLPTSCHTAFPTLSVEDTWLVKLLWRSYSAVPLLLEWPSMSGTTQQDWTSEGQITANWIVQQYCQKDRFYWTFGSCFFPFNVSFF